ncbi:MAG: glycosyltransferase [Sandaracinaceae bacterium]
MTLRVVRLVPVLDFGGVESRIVLQSRLTDRSLVDLRVCTFWKPGAAAEEIMGDGFSVDVLDVQPRDVGRALWTLMRYLREQRPDILHCSISEANLLGLVAGALTGVPVRIAEEVGMPSHGTPARLLFRLLYKTASAIVGVTQAVCDYVLEVDNAPPESVKLIYNCAHPRFFPEDRKPVERTEAQRRTLFMAGRLMPVKNQSTVLKAFARVRETHPDAKLVIAGEGPLHEDLEREIQALDIADGARLLGYREDVPALLAEAGAFVLSSHAEGCSISLIEAMATGVPSLGSDVPGIVEVMGRPLANQWAVHATDVDGWVRLFTRYLELGEEERSDLARRAQDRAYAVFSPHRYVAQLQSLYETLSTP